MSSLRLESLRLIWLETFIQVANAENISAAAREMNVDQSTVSRNLQALQKWLGKTLIEPGKVNDPENAGVNVGLSEAGNAFFAVAERVIEDLASFRTEEARRKELLDSMEEMIARMQADLNGKRPSVTALGVRAQIEEQARVVEALRCGGPLDIIEQLGRDLRRFFMRYESDLNRETRRDRVKSKASKATMPDLI